MTTKAKSIKCYAIARRDDILMDTLQPFNTFGRTECLRQINRPAGERVIAVRVNQVAQRTTRKRAAA